MNIPKIEYLKFHFRMHLRYWYTYFFLCVTLFPSFLFPVFFSMMLVHFGLGEAPAWTIMVLLGSFIFSSPLILTNYFVATDMKKAGLSKKNTFVLMLLNYSVSYVISLVLFIIIF